MVASGEDVGLPTPASDAPPTASHNGNSSSGARPQPNGPPPMKASNQPSLDRREGASAPPKSVVVQPKPQALPRRSGPASIIVSPRQKGNPILNNIKSMPWEYGDIPADYVLGLTTCALFLSLKYHRLHPEYIYTRIKNLQGKYNLRVVLCLVDIQNHEESIKELSKTSLINGVTVILCWSAAEGGRYLELFKSYENAAPTSIKQHQSTTYSDRMVDFVTTPRSVNKADAVSLVSQFGTIQTAVNARHEDVAMIAGWGEKKVQRWCTSVREPFRIQRASKRGIDTEVSILSQPVSRMPTMSRDVTLDEENSRPATLSRDVTRDEAEPTPASRLANPLLVNEPYADDEEALAEAVHISTVPEGNLAAKEVLRKRKQDDDLLGDGVMAALNKLRKAS